MSCLPLASEMAKYKEIKEVLSDVWYLVSSSAELKPKETQSLVINGTSLVLGRDEDGIAFCLRDLCPHRAVPLSEGNYDGKRIECCYHGWQFDREGKCMAIPAMGDDPGFDLHSIRVQSLPVQEKYGAIWIYYRPLSAAPSTGESIKPLISVPDLGLPDYLKMKLVSSHELTCDMDNAVIGLIDPSHVPSVHGSWLWRSKHQLKLKTKKYGPRQRGFVMKAHERKMSGLLGKILTKKASTEINFQLPGVRIELIKYGEKFMVIVLALYPVHDQLTILRQYNMTDITLIRALFPALQVYGTRFLEEDVEVVRKQSKGLQQAPSTMLVGDADRLAIWYYNLKEEHLRTISEGDFTNPVPDNSVLEYYT